jgi:hypothetical protein
MKVFAAELSWVISTPSLKPMIVSSPGVPITFSTSGLSSPVPFSMSMTTGWEAGRLA